MNLLLAAEAVVEARFARAKSAMIADVMRANGAEEHKADFVEKELRRLSKSAIMPKESCENSQIAVEPNQGSLEKNSLEIQSKLSEYCAQQMSALAEANRAEMHKMLDLMRQEITSPGNAAMGTMTSALVQVSKNSRNSMESENPNLQSSIRVRTIDRPPQELTDNDFACHACEATFPSRKKLRMHLNHYDHYKKELDGAVHHGDGNTFACRRCKARFPNNSKLQHHLTVADHRVPMR